MRLLSKQPENENLILQVVSLEQKIGLNKQAKQRILETLEGNVPSEKMWQFWIELQLTQDASRDVSADLIEMLSQFPASEWAGVKLAEIFLNDEKYAAAEKVIEKAMRNLLNLLRSRFFGADCWQFKANGPKHLQHSVQLKRMLEEFRY